MDKFLREKIEHEVCRINKLFDNGKPLLDLCKIKKPDFVEVSAVGSFLQSFYNGIENIILLIFKNIGEDIPTDSHWHKQLLDKTFEANDKRTILFKIEYKEKLFEYLSFRHYFRHSYGYELDWKRLIPLTNEIEETWKLLEEDIISFIEKN